MKNILVLPIIFGRITAIVAFFCDSKGGFLYTRGPGREKCFLILNGTRSFSESQSACQNGTVFEWRGRLGVLDPASAFADVASGLLVNETWVSLRTLTPRNSSVLPTSDDVTIYWKWYDGSTPVTPFWYTTYSDYGNGTRRRFYGPGYVPLEFSGPLAQQNQARYSPSDNEFKDDIENNIHNTLCEFVYEPVGCSSSPCRYEGNCTEQENGYTCSCQDGYTGTNCEININECISAPCKNGGYCYDQVNGYICICTVDFTGTHCENQTNVCVDHALDSYCVKIGGRFCPFSNTCFMNYYFHNKYGPAISYCHNTAPQGYRGRLPHMPNIIIHLYAAVECDRYCWIGVQSSGRPSRPPVMEEWRWVDHFINGTYTFTPLTWNGRGPGVEQREPCAVMWNRWISDHQCWDRMRVFCEYLKEDGNPCDVNECISGPCKNGGTCDDRVDGYVCFCAPGFTGTHCENGLSLCVVPSGGDVKKKEYDMVPEKSSQLPAFPVVGTQCEGVRLLCARICSSQECQMFAHNEGGKICITYGKSVHEVEFESAPDFEIWTQL